MNEFKPGYFFDLSSFEHKDIFQEITYVWEVLSKIGDYLKSTQLGKIQTKIPSGAFIVNDQEVVIGEGTIVEPGAYIRGPCLIGKNCVIRHGAYIRGNVLTGDGCVIGHDSELKNSLLLNHAHAAHFAYLGDSILGNEVNLGAGTKCANLKLNNSKIEIHFENKKIPTQLRKLGAILGDRTQIGCNAVTNPGTLMGKEVFCYPCVNIGGFVPSYSLIKPSGTALVLKRAESR